MQAIQKSADTIPCTQANLHGKHAEITDTITAIQKSADTIHKSADTIHKSADTIQYTRALIPDRRALLPYSTHDTVHMIPDSTQER